MWGFPHNKRLLVATEQALTICPLGKGRILWMKKQEETDIHHNDDIYNLDMYRTRKQNCSTEQWKISCLTSKSDLPLKTTLIMID